jgi:leucyl/phenylalanyl-tRNA--protein transferase
MVILNNFIQFPTVDNMAEDGLVALGGNLLPATLLKAYQQGIFPWYNEGEPILWWCPNPRCVLFPQQLEVSKSMQVIIKKNYFRFTVNKAFAIVINNCKIVNLQKHNGTWISDDITKAYNHLHLLGHAHSAEAWLGNELVGGLYGIQIGKVFFGESMFSKVSNASKFAFIQYVQLLQSQGIQIIDCQMPTNHLKSLGATMIQRKDFIDLLNKYCTDNNPGF